MQNKFYKLNKKYIDKFNINVEDRVNTDNIKTDVTFLKAIVKEVNDLFKNMGGRRSDKKNIPTPDEYPDAKKFNILLRDLGFDITKLFDSNLILETDVTNLMNFNSSLREKTFENLADTQQKVFSTYISSKRDVLGGLEMPESNAFSSSSSMGEQSEGVFIDEKRGELLTLSYQTKITKPIDTENVKVFLSNDISDSNKVSPYPNKLILKPGSHWKRSDSDQHHVDVSNTTIFRQYKDRLIDNINSNTGVGICQFEMVMTNPGTIKDFKYSNIFLGQTNLFNIPLPNFKLPSFISTLAMLKRLKNRVGEEILKDPSLLYIDSKNSLQGQYINDSYIDIDNQRPKFKLVIPMTSDATLTNTITLSLLSNNERSDSGGIIPSINWKESKIFTNISGSDQEHSFVPPIKNSDDGIYRCVIDDFIIPTRAEIILEYGALAWIPIPFYMSWYQYINSNTYHLPVSDGKELSLTLKKTYDLFVDAEPNVQKEKERALNILRDKGSK